MQKMYRQHFGNDSHILLQNHWETLISFEWDKNIQDLGLEDISFAMKTKNLL